MKEFKETLSVPFFDLIEKRLKENNGGNGFYVGDNVCFYLNEFSYYISYNKHKLQCLLLQNVNHYLKSMSDIYIL